MTITYCGTCGIQVRSAGACPRCHPRDAKSDSQPLPIVRLPLAAPRRRATRRFLFLAR